MSERRGPNRLDLAAVLVLLVAPVLWFNQTLWPGLSGRTLLPIDILYTFEPWQSLHPGTTAHNALLGDLVFQTGPWRTYCQGRARNRRVPALEFRGSHGHSLSGRRAAWLAVPAEPSVPHPAAGRRLRLVCRRACRAGRAGDVRTRAGPPPARPGGVVRRNRLHVQWLRDCVRRLAPDARRGGLAPGVARAHGAADARRGGAPGTSARGPRVGWRRTHRRNPVPRGSSRDERLPGAHRHGVRVPACSGDRDLAGRGARGTPICSSAPFAQSRALPPC